MELPKVRGVLGVFKIAISIIMYVSEYLKFNYCIVMFRNINFRYILLNIVYYTCIQIMHCNKNIGQTKKIIN